MVALHLRLTDPAARAHDSVGRLKNSGPAFNAPMPVMMKLRLVTGGP